MESGLQFQHEAEIAGYLLESENLLRQQVIDAQILIDGKYYQADQLVQRYFTVCLCELKNVPNTDSHYGQNFQFFITMHILRGLSLGTQISSRYSHGCIAHKC